jgi:hypothetical protein
LIGALVQAINIAIHESIEKKNQGKSQSSENEHGPEFNAIKEVIASKD